MPQSERHALVLGGGTMGVGIIAMFLGGGWKVDVVSRSASTRDGLPAATSRALKAMGKPDDVSGLATYATLEEAPWPKIDIVVETVTEDLALKQKIFADLERLSREAPGPRIVWMIRGDDIGKAFGGGANDALAARGELGSAVAEIIRQGRIEVRTSFRVSHIAETRDGLRIGAGSPTDGPAVLADELIVATGFRPDLSYLSELRLALDPALDCPPLLAPLIDPNEHSCGTVRPHGARELSQPEPGFYLAGMKSYGRAPTFLMLTGYEQVRSIAAELAGDHEAARKVELVLPETGVCSASRPADGASGCCGGPPVRDETACCAKDEVAKESGKSGCGCSGTRAA